jgi:DNA-binding MarR family transcriptional regulator
VTSLVAKGLVHRQTQPGDRRQVMLALTPAGVALHDAMFPLVRDLNHELLALLDDTQVAQLDRALDVLQQRADQLVLQADALPRADRRRGGRTVRSMG